LPARHCSLLPISFLLSHGIDSFIVNVGLRFLGRQGARMVNSSARFQKGGLSRLSRGFLESSELFFGIAVTLASPFGNMKETPRVPTLSFADFAERRKTDHPATAFAIGENSRGKVNGTPKERKHPLSSSCWN